MTRTGGNTGDAHLPEKSDIVLIFTLEPSFFAESFLKAVFRWIRWGDESQRKKVIIYREADEYLFFDEGRSEEEPVSVFV